MKIRVEDIGQGAQVEGLGHMIDRAGIRVKGYDYG